MKEKARLVSGYRGHMEVHAGCLSRASPVLQRNWVNTGYNKDLFVPPVALHIHTEMPKKNAAANLGEDHRDQFRPRVWVASDELDPLKNP